MRYLDKICVALQRIDVRLCGIETFLFTDTKIELAITDNILLALSDHLRKSYIAVTVLRKGDASRVGNYTKRSRAVESMYLNQLVERGFLCKERDGRRVIFTLKKRLKNKMRLEK